MKKELIEAYKNGFIEGSVSAKMNMNHDVEGMAESYVYSVLQKAKDENKQKFLNLVDGKDETFFSDLRDSPQQGGKTSELEQPKDVEELVQKIYDKWNHKWRESAISAEESIKEAIKDALNLANQRSVLDEYFYTDLMKLINEHCKNGLSKPDLVSKMKYATQSCVMS